LDSSASAWLQDSGSTSTLSELQALQCRGIELHSLRLQASP
jgi:hypothetical protein